MGRLIAVPFLLFSHFNCIFYTMEKNCINCDGFALWDGDFCCVKKLKILQNAPDGNFTKDILTALRINMDCEDWSESYTDAYTHMFEKFVEDNNIQL